MTEEHIRKWAWVVLAYGGVTAMLLLEAHLVRYAPMQPIGQAPLVWDRWEQRACLVAAGTDIRALCKPAARKATSNPLKLYDSE